MSYKTLDEMLKEKEKTYTWVCNSVRRHYELFDFLMVQLPPKSVYASEYAVTIYLSNVLPEEIETQYLSQLKARFPEITFTRDVLSEIEVAWTGSVDSASISIHSEYRDGVIAPGCKIIRVKYHEEMRKHERSEYMVFCDEVEEGVESRESSGTEG
jgi:hypothetical protein